MSNSAQAATLEQRFRGTFNPCEQRFRGLRRQGSCRPREHDAIVIAERERNTRHRHFIRETEKFGCRLSVCPVCTETPKPPRAYTDAIKLKLLREAGLVWQDKRLYELDHVIPICAGGDPNDPRNMRLQEWSSALRKDSAEVELCRDVCAGKISLREAPQLMFDWKD